MPAVAPVRRSLTELTKQFLFEDMHLATENVVGGEANNTATSTAWKASLNDQGKSNNHPCPLYEQEEDDGSFKNTRASSSLLRYIDLAFSKSSCAIHRVGRVNNAWITHNTIVSQMPPQMDAIANLHLNFPAVLNCIAQKKKAVVITWNWTYANNKSHAAWIIIEIPTQTVYFWDPQSKHAGGCALYDQLSQCWGGQPDVFFLPGFTYHDFDRDNVEDMQMLLENRPDGQPVDGDNRLKFTFTHDGICNAARMIVIHLCMKFCIFNPFIIEHALIRALRIDLNSDSAYLASTVFYSYCKLISVFMQPAWQLRPYRLQPAQIRAFLNPVKKSDRPTLCFGKTKSGTSCTRKSCTRDNYCWQHRAAIYNLAENNKKCSNATA